MCGKSTLWFEIVKDSAVLLIDCPDRKGLVASVSGLLYRLSANILHADQHQDPEAGLFFMRVEWDMAGFDLKAFQREFAVMAASLHMRWSVELLSARPKVAVFVSKTLHCLIDILHQHDVALIMGNHPDGGALAKFYGVEFQYFEVSPASKREVEEKQLILLRDRGIELIVLARYMQILSPEFVREHPNRIINVHHSFLPAFMGARPYHAAFQRGVKLIGATSHYVTEALDDGPIIEQDVARISHRDQVEDLIAKGRDLERVVLSRAIKWHLERRVLCYRNKTVVFD